MTQKADNATAAAQMPVPRHVAIIMDGNGRWAENRGLERSAGHVRGVDSVRNITRAASDMGIGWLTLYAFSTENWNRPQYEVDMLMHLMAKAIENETPEMLRNNVRLTVIGDMESLPDETRACLQRCIDATAHDTGLNMVLAISYSARWEITRAARMLADEAARGLISPADIDDEAISSRLSTAGMPDPDLLIRTGGEMRLSNFLLWQMAYGELYVTDTYWPDFDKAELEKAIKEYNGRQRRFGKTGAQVENEQNSITSGKTDPTT